MQRREKRQCLTWTTKQAALGASFAEPREVQTPENMTAERGVRFHQGKLSPFHFCSSSLSRKEENRESPDLGFSSLEKALSNTVRMP